MCATDTDCGYADNVLGPIDAKACNIGAMRTSDPNVVTIFSRVKVVCAQ
jgi:hypothetical protein